MKPDSFDRRPLVRAAIIALGASLALSCGATPHSSSGAPKIESPSGGASGNANRGAGSVVWVQTATVSVGTLRAEKTSSAVVVPAVQSQVAAQQGGVVARVVRSVGDWVKPADVVAVLDDTQLKLTLKTAQANLENARINLKIAQDNTSLNAPKLNLQVQAAQSSLAAAQKNYASAQALYQLGGNSGSDVDNALAALQQAQANLETAKISLEQNKSAETQNLAQLQIAVDQASLQVQQAELNLRNSSIKAPFYGQIAQINVAPGSYVSSNTSVFLLVSAEHFVSFNVPPTDAATLAFGTKVQFQFAGSSFPAQINIVPSAPVNGQVPMTATLASKTVAVGTLGIVTYSLELGKGLLIPLASLQSSEDTTFVFEVKGGKALRVPVVVLAEAGDTALVSGLNAGASLVVSPPPGLLPGASVQSAVGNADSGTPTTKPRRSGDAP